MTRLLLIITILFTSSVLFAQSTFTVSGRIIDSATREPLSGASVYCQNTTVGSATNKQGDFSLDLKSGGYDLVVSFTGYRLRQMRISASDGRLGDIAMSKEEKSMGEVVIKSSNEVRDGWEKYGSFFTDHFIGTTPNAGKTRLLNPEVLHFYLLKKSNKLRVLATEPLQIENQALGYNLRYSMDSFIYFYNTDINTYRGFCLYSQMEGSDSIKAVWATNRRNAYQGSKLQFMRSYYDSSVVEDGWIINLLDESDDKKFNPVSNVYDTTYYGGIDSTRQLDIWYPRKFSVAYKLKPAPEYLKQYKLPKDVPLQLSYIDLKDAITIQENGYFYDQKDWVNQGYWSWKNLADQLPYDYEP